MNLNFKNAFTWPILFAVSFLCISSFPSPLSAQTNALDAVLEGYVRDPSSSPVPKAKVVVRNIGTGISSQTVTNSAGYYRFPLLKVGTYEMTVNASGFKQYQQSGISLSVGQNGTINVTLQIGSLSQTVVVSENTPMTETGTASVGAVLQQKAVANLPIVSRNIYNYFLLTPGVIGMPSSTFSTTQFTFGGTFRAAWSVDGLDNTERSGSYPIRMVITTPEAVQETQVLSNGYSAEFGRAAGGQVNVILKSGTNDFHGSALFLYRFKDMQARPSLSATDPDRTWRDAAATLGGPIIKDRLFFFFDYEDNPYTLPTPITISAANAAALQLPSSQIGESPFGETYRTLVGKINYKLNDRNFGSFFYDRFTNHQPVTAGGLTITERGTNFNDDMNGGGAQLATVLTPNLLNELRVGVIRRTQADAPGAGPSTGAYINISGVANIGYNPLAKTSTTEQSSEVKDNLSWTHGRSTVKVGTDFEHTGFNILKAQNREFLFGGLPAANGRGAVSPLNQYLYTLQGQIDPATGKPYTYTEFLEDGGDPRLNIGFNFLNFFAQDEFRLTPNFTVNAGLRWEAILFPEFDPQAPYALSRQINNDLTDFAPRFAFTWAPFPSRKTVIRGAYGMYYDVPPLSIFYTAAQVNGHRFLSYQVSGTDPQAPVFPNVPQLTGSEFLVPPNIYAFPPGFHNAYQHQANLQIQRELTSNVLLTVGYDFAALRHGLYSINTNLGAPVGYLADGRPVFGGAAARPNPNFNQINFSESGGNSNYNGLFVNITKRFSKGIEFSVNYNYSHALSDTLGTGGAPEDPTNLQRDYGSSEDDARHAATAQVVYSPITRQPWLKWINGFTLSSTVFYESGYPINPVVGFDLNGDGVLNDRPLFVSRDSIEGPSNFQMDARLTRTFKIRERYQLMPMIEAENLLNSTNASCSISSGCSGAVVNTAGASDFGRIISARTARNVQIGAKFTF